MNDCRTALLVMAAGLGSRFGTGIKQLTKVGPTNELIMDYSIHDAVKAGFNKIIFVIRKDIEQDFRQLIGNRIEEICAKHKVDVAYAFQDINDILDKLPAGRTKPWGTGHAVLSAKHHLNMPFAVINADDYYGKESFRIAHDELVNNDENCMVAYSLKNTLSDFGKVTRGICCVEDGYLQDITETRGIEKSENGARANGVSLDMNSMVSMNLWGFRQSIVDTLEEAFRDFFKNDVVSNPLTSEFLIPEFIQKQLHKSSVCVKVISTNDEWHGLTYKEDVPLVREAFMRYVELGMYRKNLFSDL